MTLIKSKTTLSLSSDGIFYAWMFGISVIASPACGIVFVSNATKYGSLELAIAAGFASIVSFICILVGLINMVLGVEATTEDIFPAEDQANSQAPISEPRFPATLPPLGPNEKHWTKGYKHE